MSWPATPDDLAREQDRLAQLVAALRVGACAVVFGGAGDDGVGWAAAVADDGREGRRARGGAGLARELRGRGDGPGRSGRA